MRIDWQFLVSERVLEAVWSGFQFTISVSLLSAIGGFLIAIVVAFLQVSGRGWLSSAGRGYVAVFRNIPLIVQLFFWYFGLPMVVVPRELPFLIVGNYEVTVATLVVSLYVGAYASEVIRGGIEAIPYGQFEAAMASGLNQPQAFRYIIIPQLIPIVLPGMTNEAINVVKNTSLTMAIGVPELTSQAQQIEAETFRGFEAMTAVTLAYIVVSGSIFAIMAGLERLVRRET